MSDSLTGKEAALLCHDILASFGCADKPAENTVA
jgi:hypothetical protein